MVNPIDEHQRDYVSTEDLDAARTRLSAYMLHQADKMAEIVGFGYVPAPDAPSTFPALQEAFAHSVTTGTALPVSNEHTDSVVYVSRDANMAFRFVHDCAHIRLKLDFTARDEYELACWHLRRLEVDGFARDSLEWELLRADTLGQVLISAIARRFPDDQHSFGMTCVAEGFEYGVLAELRRMPPATSDGSPI